jgi:hypothetical protein
MSSSIRRVPRGDRTLYATAFGRGVYKSTGQRAHLACCRTRASSSASRSRGGITRSPDGALYLVVARRSERGRIGDADDGALYRSPTVPRTGRG